MSFPSYLFTDSYDSNFSELPTEREMDLWAELQATKETLRSMEDEVTACKREKVRFLETLTKIAVRNIYFFPFIPIYLTNLRAQLTSSMTVDFFFSRMYHQNSFLRFQGDRHLNLSLYLRIVRNNSNFFSF